MEFLGIGPLELLAIFLIIVLVIGPKDLERTARTLGRALNRLFHSDSYRAVQRMSQELRHLPERLAREAQLDEVKQDVNQIMDPALTQIKQAWTPAATPPPAPEPPSSPAPPPDPPAA
jgi:Sec-independent protein translocase protein TatA